MQRVRRLCCSKFIQTYWLFDPANPTDIDENNYTISNIIFSIERNRHKLSTGYMVRVRGPQVSHFYTYHMYHFHIFIFLYFFYR